MSLNYRIYDNYDPNALNEIKLGDYISKSLARYEAMLKYIQETRSDLHDGFVKMLIDKLRVNSPFNEMQNLREFINKTGESYPHLSETGLLEALIPYTIETLTLSEKFPSFDQKYVVLLVNIEKGENLPHYHAIQTLVDLLGRENGLFFYKEFVNHINSPPPPRQVESFRAFRNDAVEDMAKSGGFEFIVYDFDESMWIGRFNKCVVYDSLKAEADREIGYLATCYNGLIGCNKRDWCIRLRRTQTLYSAEYCDELYWDRHVHDEPEQPSLEFTERMIIE
ncbi:MAG: hypothetical protein ACFFEJ_11910 [Candidatus Thorarchaeota archaeon]